MKFFESIETYISYALLALMTVIVISATLEVGYVIATDIFKPPGFFIGVEDLFDLFGLFLMVLIGLELMASIQMYIKSHEIHAEIMLLIAITAITRKVVILDAKVIDPLLLFGIAAVIVALTLGFYLLRRSRIGSGESA
jgi:uncharacterized membrane protein (DUF373 family)